MPKYSVIRDNKVVNLMMADSLEDAQLLSKLECRELNESFPYGTDCFFDGTNWIDPYKTSNTEETNA